MNSMLLSGFEPESKPRKGLMIGRYTTGAIFYSSFRIRIILYNFFTFVKPYITQMSLPLMRCVRW